MGTDCCPHIPNPDGFVTPLESALTKALGVAGSDEKEKKCCLQRAAGCKRSVPALGLSQPHGPVPMLYALPAGHQKQLTSK